jgi:hypothetical protein
MLIIAEDEYLLMFNSADMLLCKNTPCHVCRLICSVVVEDTAVVADDTDHEDNEYLSFSCSLPGSRGRGFIEVQI